jgi:hypothetical protein
MKKKKRPSQQKKRKASEPKRVAPPREVYLAIRNLLDTTNHIQARAAELENALDLLREQERSKVFQQILLALRNSQDGDLLRFNPTAQADESSLVKAIVEALIEAFEIEPFHQIGERIPVKRGEIPDNLELDRSIGEEAGKCVAVEVTSPGWKMNEKTLLKPMVRPVFN